MTTGDQSQPTSDTETTEDVFTENLAPVFTQLNTRTTGYHFGPLSFRPGKDGVRDVLVGDPGIPGVISIKVVFASTKSHPRRPAIFTVPIQQLILEEEELPIEVVSSLESIKNG